MFGNSFPTHAQTTLFWWPIQGFGVSSITCSFSEEPSVSKQEPVAATEDLWPGLPSGVFQKPYSWLCPSSYHPNRWGSHFLTSFQMMTRPINIVQAWVRHLRDLRVPATWKFPWRIRELWDGPDHRASTLNKTTCMLHVRHILLWAKQSPSSPGHCFPNRIVRWNPQPVFPITFTSFPFHLGWFKEPKCCLWAIPRVPSTFQESAKWWVTQLLPGISVFPCLGHMVL